jgi:hypothetical protein
LFGEKLTLISLLDESEVVACKKLLLMTAEDFEEILEIDEDVCENFNVPV